jgi:hypothetical protein
MVSRSLTSIVVRLIDLISMLLSASSAGRIFEPASTLPVPMRAPTISCRVLIGLRLRLSTTAGNLSNTVMMSFGASLGLRAANSTSVLRSARPKGCVPVATRVTDSTDPPEPSMVTLMPWSRKIPLSAPRKSGALPP